MRENNPDSLGANVGGARNIARRLLKDAKIKDIPVSLWKIIEYLKGRHDLIVLKHNFDKLDGILVEIGDGPPTIGFNPDRAWVRRRFTISHEIGHMLMGHTCEGTEAKTPVEHEANQFAAELLMPLAIIKADYKANPDLDELSRKYVVSKEALCWHLMEVRIIK